MARALLPEKCASNIYIAISCVEPKRVAISKKIVRLDPMRSVARGHEPLEP
jgi:hypothetical protein